MSRDFPDWISPERAAEGKRVFSGTVPLSRMKRLLPLLAQAEGDASFVAAFRRDLDNRVIIDLQVEASLPLTCQASLEVYDEEVKRFSELAVIEDQSEQAGLPDSFDFVKTENGRLALATLVEDELLLGLPHIPRKPGLERVEYSTGGPVAESDDSQDKVKKNPFAVLQDLLERD